MLTEPWQRYQHLYQSFASSADASVPPEVLYKTALLLSKQRQACVMATYDSLDQTARQLSTPLWRIEVLLYLARCYQLHPLNRHLLLLAGCCSALVSMVQTVPSPYPALTAARQLKPLSQAAGVVKVLSSCYGAERKQPQWQQTLLSLLLTQSEYWSDSSQWPAQLATRLMLSQSDYELAILRRLLQNRAATELAGQQDTFAGLLQHSCFSELCHYDNKALEHYLTAAPERSAPILALATQLNRRQQQVQSVKLALGIIGRDTLPAALAQAELAHYLGAMQHPWHDVFSQFCHVLAQALQLFIPKLQSAGSRLLALCCCAPLWLNPFYPRRALVIRSNNGYQSAFTPALHCQSDTYHTGLLQLLQLYRLDHYSAAVMAWLKPQTQPRLTVTAVNLQLAWHSSLVLYCGASSQTVNKLLAIMHGQTAVTAEIWLQQLLHRSRCYYPISLKL